MSLRVSHLKDGRKALILRTSDRGAFRECRRRWGWSSHLKRNLGSKHLASPLWFGSAIHFALEDYHGLNKFGRPSLAFRAYCLATSKQFHRELPGDAQEHYQLGIAMMDYYVDHWLRFRKIRPIYVENGIPQVEVNFEIPIPLDEHPVLAAHAKSVGADCILYRGTIDGVVYDEEQDALLLKEYKTAKRAEHMHYMIDSQVSTYLWAMTHIYDKPVIGIEYWQFIKNKPAPPKILSSGKISTASNLASSYPLYYQALEDMYGSADRAPAEHKKKLAEIGQTEGENRDRYVVRETVYRNAHQTHAEAMKILLEAEDMLNPDLPLYPNPTRDCSWKCSFMAACITMDDGGDWENELAMEFSERDQAPDRLWRRRLPDIDTLLALVNSGQEPQLDDIQNSIKTFDEDRQDQIMKGDGPDLDYRNFSM